MPLSAAYAACTVLLVLALTLGAGPALGQEEESTFFSTVWVDDAASIATESDGDLWPSAWGADGTLYSANGDGRGFTTIPGEPDIVVNAITGGLKDLRGVSLAAGDAVGSIWTPGGHYNRKPTGMISVEGVLYLAVQDLNRDFNDVPAASISRSADGGRTWEWDRSGPMFNDYTFTTIFFVDYGQDNRHAPDGYVYAYGLDHNWRDSFNDRVPDPTALFLARVPGGQIMRRAAWEFFAGKDAEGRPRWSPAIAERRPVLETGRRVYPRLHAERGAHNMSVLSQGGVVYNKPLNRYLYTSWTEYTFEFFEAPEPWGPWKLFHRKDFGAYPWTRDKFGGYGATIPSKFISPDGRTMYIQDNTFVGGMRNYRFSLRKMRVEPRVPSQPGNPPNPRLNLGREGQGVAPVAKTFHLGLPTRLNDGNRDSSEDDWDQEDKPASWWGYTWRRAYHMDTVVFTSGRLFEDGGWFRETPRVQVRQDGRWVDAHNQSVSPAYPGTAPDAPFQTFTFRFDRTHGDGVRIIGAPGGVKTFSSVAELEVYYTGGGASAGS